MSQFQKNLALWLVISLLMIMLFNMMSQREGEQKQGRKKQTVLHQITPFTQLDALASGKSRPRTISGADKRTSPEARNRPAPGAPARVRETGTFSARFPHPLRIW